MAEKNAGNMNSVCHLTSVHPRFDVRIFLKQCRSLAAAGYDVALVVADSMGDEIEDGILIYDAGLAKGRLDRMLRTTRRVYKKALELDADIYHLHDPELIPLGLKLQKRGKKVIFDAHEDLPAQIMAKPYLHASVKKCLSAALRIYEARVCRRLDAVVAATPHIRDKFLAVGANALEVCNYPILGELSFEPADQTIKQAQVCYIGGIDKNRGIREMVQAMDLVQSQVRLQLGGLYEDTNLRDEIGSLPGWSRVDELGWLGRIDVSRVLGRSLAGLVTLHPTPNYIKALPIKMFEYMSAGIPVIASDFPLWREIVVGNDCGICVDPLDPKAIAQAVDFLVANPSRAAEMGRQGRQAVEERYNWQAEFRKLIRLYQDLLGAGPIA